ncbi:MAG TPA: hypothetical protein VKB43_05100 [Gaiellaceae bacterium]|nr:hypothetical protein [Gaiellaceae bacterium]
MAVIGVLAVALAVAAAGCGSGSHASPTTTRTATRAQVCPLSAKQRRAIQRAKLMIVQMHHLEAPLKTVHPVGPPALENELNRFLLTIGVLPPDERGLLIRKAKAATALCQDCFDALESFEPAPATRYGGGECAPGG